MINMRKYITGFLIGVIVMCGVLFFILKCFVVTRIDKVADRRWPSKQQYDYTIHNKPFQELFLVTFNFFRHPLYGFWVFTDNDSNINFSSITRENEKVK